jgi:enamine deaminase RidA (YjgF/YER057c/UK114 family)
MRTARFNPAGMWAPHGRAFNQGVVEPEGRVLHMTGQVAWDADSRVIYPGDFEAQVRKCFENVERVLAEVGGALSDLVSLTVYFTDPSQLPIIQKVRAEKLPADTAPVSILIQVPGLVHPDLRVELVPVAVIPFDRYHDPR